MRWFALTNLWDFGMGKKKIEEKIIEETCHLLEEGKVLVVLVVINSANALTNERCNNTWFISKETVTKLQKSPWKTHGDKYSNVDRCTEHYSLFFCRKTIWNHTADELCCLKCHLFHCVWTQVRVYRPSATEYGGLSQWERQAERNSIRTGSHYLNIISENRDK